MKGSEDEGVMASFQEDLDVRIKPLEEAYPNLKINKQIVPGRYDPIAWVFPSSYSIRRIF